MFDGIQYYCFEWQVKTLSISLDGLLDYDEEDRDENSFEVSEISPHVYCVV